jgi:hypothetical protein
MRIHGSVEKLTQVIGTTQQDFINGAPNNDTGSQSIVCDKFGNCKVVPNP